MATKNGPKNNAKNSGRTARTLAAGQGTDTHVEMQRQIRNVGTNRLVGKADHLHRGDRRDTSVMK